MSNLGYFMGYHAKPLTIKGSTVTIKPEGQQMAGSKYSDGKNGRGIAATAVISMQVTKAVVLLAGETFVEDEMTIAAKYNDTISNVELYRDGTTIEVAQFNGSAKEKIRAEEYDVATSSSAALELTEGKRRGTAILIALMPLILQDGEAKIYYDKCIEYVKAIASGDSTKQKLLEISLATLSDNIYFRMKEKLLSFDVLQVQDGTEKAFMITDKDKVVLSDEDATFSVKTKEFVYFKDEEKKEVAKDKKASKKASGSKDDGLTGKFKLNKRKLTDDEKLLVPTIPSYYVVPTVAKKIAKAIQKSTDMNRVIRNIMLKGPAGTGKTEISKAIAAAHNLPYTHITCSAGMELIDILGTFVPQPDGTFKFQKSEFLKAVENGWVCEVQEPTVIIQPGVLPGLNSILEGGSITLITGEVIQRHPDSIIIFTTNVDYEGCRSMNESVEDRFPLKFYVELPNNKEMIERVKKVTNFKGEDVYIEKALECLQETQSYLENQGYSTGKVGARVLYDWIDACQIFEDMVEAADYTLVQSASDDADIQDYIKTRIVRNVNWKNLVKITK